MSKKKVTMTLKDFHGGHIPSDLPLPSAPGLPSRPVVDRGGFDRQTSYGNPVGRSENRLRPASAGSVRNLDDENIFFNYNSQIGRNFDEDERKPLYGVSGPRRTIGEESIPTQHSRVTEPKAEDTSPFLSHGLHVGRNFDEDERKPLNGVSGPRRTVSDESIHAQPSHVMELKKDQTPSLGHTTNFRHSFDEDEVKPLNGASDPRRKVGDEVHNAGPNSQNFGGGRGHLSNHTNVGARNGPYANAWGLKKEIKKSVKESVSSSGSPIPDPAMKLAQASALEKVSSGRWTSKQHVPPIKNHEVIGKVESEVGPDYKAENNVENEKVGQMIPADRTVPADMWSNERKTPFTFNEQQPLDVLSCSPQTVGVNSFVAAHSSLVVEPRTENKSGASVVSRAPPVTVTQAGSSYFGGPNSYWSKEPVSIAWSSPDVIRNLPHSGSFESDNWNSKQHIYHPKGADVNGHLETPGEFDYRTNNISNEYTSNKIVANRLNVVDDSKYHDLSEMMHAKGNLVAADEIYNSGKEMRSYESHESNIQMAETKLGYAFGSRVVNRAQSPQISGDFTSSSFGFHQQFSGDVNYWSGNSNVVGNVGKPAIGPYSNPRGDIKAMISMKEPVSVDWSASDITVKLTNAGAFDKVSSGIWSSKQYPSKYDGSVGHIGSEGDFEYKEGKDISAIKYTTNRLDVMEETGFRKPSPPLPVERSLAVDCSTHGGGKEVPPHERVRSFEKNSAGSQLISGKSSNAESRSTLPTESLERPKLKLLPRSKPLEISEPRVGLNQGFGQSKDDTHVANSVFESRKSEFSGIEVADQAPPQPKLNLKPRTQPIEQLKGSGDISRETVFGGARPREVVLKERGAEDDMCHSKSQLPLRANETARKDDPCMYVASTRYSERAENTLKGQRTTKYTNRLDHQLDSARIDSQRRNFRQNETRKNHKEVEKNRQVQERPASPETWRKPVDPPSSSDGPPLRFGKAASAVELAQAFSRSVSDPSLSDQSSGSRNVSGRGQVPFSRLMGPTPRLQINGY